MVRLRDPGDAERWTLDHLDAGLDALRQHGTAVPIVEQQDATRLERGGCAGQHVLEPFPACLVARDVEQRDDGVKIALRAGFADIAAPESYSLRVASAARLGSANHISAEVDAGDGPSPAGEFMRVHAGAAAEVQQ